MLYGNRSEMKDNSCLKVDYQTRRNLCDGVGAYITNVVGRAYYGASSPAARMRLAVVHLGAMMNDAVNAATLKNDSLVGSILSVVLDPRGILKTLGPWAAPINGDVAILCDLYVEEEHRRKGVATSILNDALRAFAGSCAYVILPTDKLESVVIKALEGYGFALIAPGLMAMAMDYTPSLMSQRQLRMPGLAPVAPVAKGMETLQDFTAQFAV